MVRRIKYKLLFTVNTISEMTGIFYLIMTFACFASFFKEKSILQNVMALLWGINTHSI